MNNANTEMPIPGDTCFDCVSVQEYGMERGVSITIIFAILFIVFMSGLRRKLKHQNCHIHQFLCLIFSFLSFFSGLLIVTLEAKSNLKLLESLQGQTLDIIAYQSILSLVANLFYPVIVTCVGLVFMIILYQKNPNKLASSNAETVKTDSQ